jgi:chromosome segregation ATPase
MKKDNEILKMGIAQLSTKYENIESDSKSEKETNRKQNEENKETINMLCMQIDEANSKMKEHDSLKKDFQVLKRKHDASKYDLQKKEQEIKTLQSNLKVLEEERKESNRRNTELKEKIETVMLEKESLHNELGKEKERHDSELRKSKDLSNKVAVLTSEREKLLSENINLQQELETYKSKKIIQGKLNNFKSVFLYYIV